MKVMIALDCFYLGDYTMKRLSLALLFCLWLAGLVTAQENQSPYDIALERIRYESGVRDDRGGIAISGTMGGTTESRETLDLSGLGLTELPPEIGILANLEELNLRDNQLNSLPLEMAKLSNLEVLDLSNNQPTTLTAAICGWQPTKQPPC
jgi:hypothetical protein